MSSTMKFSIVIVLFLAVYFGYSMYNQWVADNPYALHSEVVYLEDGYGYQIMRGEKILILQEYIPGVSGRQAFSTKKEALDTADFVISKLEDGKSPVLMPADLSRLNVSTLGSH